MQPTKNMVLTEINYRLQRHPGDAPWSCLDCYNNRPCVIREILLLAKAQLECTGVTPLVGRGEGCCIML